VAENSERRGHYYAGSNNEFWKLLYESGLTKELLVPEQDQELILHGLGLTDLVTGMSQSHDRGLRARYDVSELISVLGQYEPPISGIHHLGSGTGYGPPDWGSGPDAWLAAMVLSGEPRL
jgi:hypothetical protein